MIQMHFDEHEHSEGVGQPSESRLSDAELLILEGLEAKAEADDPHLAATLRGGSGRLRTLPHPSLSLPHGLSLPHVELHPRIPDQVAGWAWGALVGVAGFVVMILALSASLPASIVGLLMACLGVGRVVVCIAEKQARPVADNAGGEPSDGPPGTA